MTARRGLSLLLTLALVFGLFSSMASAASSTPSTTFEKYQWFIEQGILQGTTTGDAQLDDVLNRAQFATIIASLEGLATTGQTRQSFSDVKRDQWWYGAIEASAKAGLMNGTGDNLFEPRKDVTIEQVATVAVRMAKLPMKQDTVVNGSSKWAGPSIEAAIKAGLIKSAKDYTVAATRGNTFDIAYEVYKMKNKNGTSVLSAAATGSKEIKVIFNQAVDTSKVKIKVRRGSNDVNVTRVVWDDAKKIATLEITSTLRSGDYTATISGIEVINSSVSFKVENEKAVGIAVDNVAYRSTADISKATLGYYLTNQYGEKYNGSSQIFVTSNTLGITTNNASSTSVELNGLTLQTTSVQIAIFDVTSQVRVEKQIAIANEKSLASITLKQPVPKSGDSSIMHSKQYEIPYEAKDQYGNAYQLKDTELTKSLTINKDPVIGSVSINREGQLLIAFSSSLVGPNNVYLHALVNATGSNSRIEFVVNGKSSLSDIRLHAQSGEIGADEDGLIEVTGTDQYGNKVSAGDIQATYHANKLTVVTGNNSVFQVNGITAKNNKAYVSIKGKGAGEALLTVTVNETGKGSSQRVAIVEARQIHSISLVADYTKAFVGGTLTVKAIFRDQYGSEMNSDRSTIVKLMASGEDADAFTNDAPSNLSQSKMQSGIKFTAAKAGKTAVYTVAIERDGKTIDAAAVTLSTVGMNENLNYIVEPIGTIADEAGKDSTTSGKLASPYAKEVKAIAVDSYSAQVVLPVPILKLEPADSRLLVATTGSTADKWFVAAAREVSKDTDTSLNVTVRTATGTPLVINVPVRIASASPVAQTLVFENQAKEPVNVVTIATGATIDFFNTSSIAHVVIKDQYGTTALGSPGKVGLYVTNPQGTPVQSSSSSVRFTSPGLWNITVIAGDKSATLQVIVNS